jgi:coproporphyrinogen dehydrogenase HemZ
MLVSENIDLYRYEIHSLVKAFYPEEEVRVVVEGDPHAQKARMEMGDPSLFVHMSADAITLTFAGKEPVSVCHGGPGEEEFKGPFNVKSRQCKDALKSCLYTSLCAHTGKTLPWGDLIGIRPTKIAMTKMESGATKEDAVSFMENIHRVSPQKAQLAADIAVREKKILSGIHYDNGYSLYIGIPFCPTTCLYCSFPSNAIGLWKERVDDYLTALEKEMAAMAPIFRDKVLDTVYFGGGTPTTLDPMQLDRVITAVKRYFPNTDLQEFTVEAGRPDSITKDKLEVLRANGVTRISVNPQSMRQETLDLIGRLHSVQDVRDAFHTARCCGFDNINMDIILGLPGENIDDVRYTVGEVEKLGPDSLTVHSLAIKRASRMQKWIQEHGMEEIHNTDDMMQVAAQGAERMGMKPYYLYRQKNMSGNFENVGYARPGRFGIYNILIMEEKQSILALGAGSISKIVMPCEQNGVPGTRIERCDNAKDVATYIDHIDEMIGRKRALFA